MGLTKSANNALGQVLLKLENGREENHCRNWLQRVLYGVATTTGWKPFQHVDCTLSMGEEDAKHSS